MRRPYAAVLRFAPHPTRGKLQSSLDFLAGFQGSRGGEMGEEKEEIEERGRG